MKNTKGVNKKRWSDYLYIFTIVYLLLGFFNIVFAWLGMLCFLIPLIFAFFGGKKGYCNEYCGRGKLLFLLGNRFKLSRNKSMLKWMRSSYFRYGFLIFFMTMFVIMIVNTFLVFKGADLKEIVTLFWTFKVPWHWAYYGGVDPWFAQFAFGFYSIMLTSTLLGLISMFLFKPKTWCVYCPMGTMTQSICKLKYRGEEKIF